MKYSHNLLKSSIVISSMMFLFLIACKKEKEEDIENPNNNPTPAALSVTTIDFSQITDSSAYLTGSISYTSNVVDWAEKGFCWNTSGEPTINDSKAIDETVFDYSIMTYIYNLDYSTNYHFRAYVIYDGQTLYGNEMSFTTMDEIPKIGVAYEGGILAYLFQPGDNGYVEGEIHGIVALENDLNSTFEWGCHGTEIPNANGIELGTGMQNTQEVVSACSDTEFAAKACNDLTENGYNDWFLPSRDELAKLYANKNAIGGFANSNYWTSSQGSATNAVNIDFNNGFQYTVPGAKSDPRRVRPVRYF